MKKNVAIEALHHIPAGTIGIGTGSTINIFIEELAKAKLEITAVSSSNQTTLLLKQHKIPVINCSDIIELPIYIDGADAYNKLKQLIKGKGGALTQEKILAYASKKFICIVDENKKIENFNHTTIPLEVIPMARSIVAREILKLGGEPIYRNNFITDNGNIILDINNLPMDQPIKLEQELNNIPGVVANGIFAVRGADVIIVGTKTGSFSIT